MAISESSGLLDTEEGSYSREYRTYDSALSDLLEDHEEDSQIVEVFKALKEEERLAREVGEELGLERSNVSASLSQLKDEGFAYMMGSQKSGFYWGLDIEKLYGPDYVRLD